jgi:hypothetical protein
MVQHIQGQVVVGAEHNDGAHMYIPEENVVRQRVSKLSEHSGGVHMCAPESGDMSCPRVQVFGALRRCTDFLKGDSQINTKALCLSNPSSIILQSSKYSDPMSNITMQS